MAEPSVATLQAPFPYFGGKARIASLVWRRLGAVSNYIEPFFGSGAVLLNRPMPFAGVETVNDIDCCLANFWRSIQRDPDAVAAHADYPVSELDLHARHRWLVSGPGSDEFRERMRGDPDYHDAKRAGWWVWGICQWIGGGWCWNLTLRRPHLGDAGRGPLADWFAALSTRLQRVRICCGDWRRVCSSPSTLRANGATAVFLDPPYSTEAGRANDIYACDSATVAHDVRDWCLRWGGDRNLRIALCGYEGEGHKVLEGHGWRVEAWKTSGGYGRQGQGAGRDNAFRERIWFSPGCLFKAGLFDHLEESS